MFELSARTAKKQNNAILLCTDENYEKYAFALIKQLSKHRPKLLADICLVSEHLIVPPESLRDLPVRYCQIEMKPDDIVFPVQEHLTFACYLRLFAISALADDYDRILYLDIDIYFARGDLNALFNLPLLPDHAIGAVRDMPQQFDLQEIPLEAKKLGLPHFPYFNSGVMLVDTERWVEQDILSCTLEQIRLHPQAMRWSDQSALNLALRGRWSELSWYWNMMYRYDIVFDIVRLRPALIHFTDHLKPWIAGLRFFPASIPRWYARFLATHYDLPLEDKPDLKRNERPFFYIQLLKYGRRGAKRHRQYRHRVRDPLAVLDPNK